MLYKDQLNRLLQIESVPKRIISLVPSQTELLVDLGLEDVIVGVTKFCIHPESLRKKKTIVGGTKQVHYDKIKELQPDIILCNKEENTKEMVIKLEQIAHVHVSDISTIDDTIELIAQYGTIFSVEDKATEITNELIYLLKDFTSYMCTIPVRSVAYFIWKNPWMVAANNTIINHLLSINNFENVYGKLERYPEIDVEQMMEEKKPELIFLSSEPYPFKQKHIEELQLLNPKAKIILVNGEYFSWYGTRLLGAFDYFKNLHTLLEAKF